MTARRAFFGQRIRGAFLAAGIAILAGLTPGTPARADLPHTEAAILHASDAQASDYFGGGVAVDGDTLVIGASQEDGGAGDPLNGSGAVYVFERNQGGADTWGQLKILRASDAQAGDYFGCAAAIDGDIIVVGARLEDGGPGNPVSLSGAAYIFYRNQGGADNWGQVARLADPSPLVNGYFGTSVGVDDDTVVIGSSGRAYVFARNQGGADAWGLAATLLASDGETGDGFGNAVAISGEAVVVGASGEDGGAGNPINSAGAAYVFSRNHGGADTWGQVAKLSAAAPTATSWLGAAVSIAGDTVAAGAPMEGGKGAAHIFARNQGGADNWGEVTVVAASDAPSSAQFGSAINLGVDTLVVGAYAKAGATGSAYVYHRNQGGADQWGETAILAGSDTQSGDQYGYRVAVSGDSLVIGAQAEDGGAGDPAAQAGAAYVYTLSGGTWLARTKSRATNPGVLYEFGNATVMEGDTMIVGAHWENGGAGGSVNQAGAAYVLDRNQGGNDHWGVVGRLLASDTQAVDEFGYSVALNADTAIVGAPLEDGGPGNPANNAGAAYIFRRNVGGADAWGEVKILHASDAQANDQFGRSVAVNGDTAFVGAPLEDGGGTQTIDRRYGAVYVFGRNQGGVDNWGQVKILRGSDTEMYDYFGWTLALDGDTLVVGVEYEDGGPGSPLGASGAAYVFERNQGGADNWGEVAILRASDRASQDYFGCSVAIHGDRIAVLAEGEDGGPGSPVSYAGATYVFDRNQGGANAWGQVAILRASDAQAADGLGAVVAMHNDVIAVGVYAEDGGAGDPAEEAGAVYVFERNQGGADAWGQTALLRAPDLEASDRFGYSVAVGSGRVVIGAPRESGEPGALVDASGSMYVYEFGTPVYDFGDLPASYALTTLADGGAQHERPAVGRVYLGAAFDVEDDGQESVAADADDTTDADDEDGIAVVGNWDNGTGGGAVEVTVSGGAGYLSGWIDWNGDNDFADSGERVLNMAAVAVGTHTNTFNIPAGALVGAGSHTNFARFRLWTNSTPALTTGGLVHNGEVEDYRLVFEVVDTTPPELIIPPDLMMPVPGNVDPSFTGTPLVTDDYDPAPSVTYADVVLMGVGDGSSVGQIRRTWTAEDASGNSVDDVQIIEVTWPPLRVLSHGPTTNQQNIAAGANVSVTCNVPVNVASVDADAFNVDGSISGKIAGGYSVADNVITFDPTHDFAYGEVVTITLTADLTTDPDGDPWPPKHLQSPPTWQFFVAPAAGPGSFARKTPVGTGADHSYSVAFADMDLDGRIDLVVGKLGQPNVVYFNDGDGTFDTRSATFGTGSDETVGVAVGDLNGDGYPDIVVGNVYFKQSRIYFNDGLGGFASSLNVGPANASTFAFALADFNGDGHLDIATGRGSGQSDVIYFNDGDGTFDTTSVNLGTGAGMTADLVAADVDGDGDLDVVIGNTSQNKVYINDGDGTFDTTSYDVGAPSQTTYGIAVADLDADGDLDIATGGGGTQNRVFYNDGDGTFDTSSTTFGTGTDATYKVRAADINADGYIDLVVANISSQQNVVYFNDGTGSFAASSAIGTDTQQSQGLAIGDADGDGDLDIAVANYLAQPDAVYLNAYPLDFGDAPAPYPTLAAHNGARHETTGPRLGSARDSETDGHPSANADGDDGAGTADEDGVTDFGLSRIGHQGAVASVNVQNAPGGATLDAWIDFNRDGCWGGPHERIAAGLAVTNGINHVAYDVPCDAIAGFTYARFRISTAGVKGATGAASDGEVEDYRVQLTSPAAGTATFAPARTIGALGDSPTDLRLVDLDRDGDVDVVTSSAGDDRIAWYENDGSQSFAAHTISTSADYATAVVTEDVDGDGDIDILSASRNDDTIAWYENNGSQAFTEHVISTAADGARSVFAADVDGDGDVDVLSASWLDDKITWYENNGNQSFAARTITTTANGAWSVFAADVDRDGDMDVLSASGDDDTIAWYENNGSQVFTKHAIATAFDYPACAYATDFDGDGDMDVLTASRYDDSVVWHRNAGGQVFIAQEISTAQDWAYSVYPADIDGDGEVDVAVGSGNFGGTAWYQNDGYIQYWRHTLATSPGNLTRLHPADMDGDGDLDLVEISEQTDVVRWYEQVNRDFGDAPDSYLTTAGAGGPSHIALNPMLGATRDTEADGRPTADADGDDGSGEDDEDGVSVDGDWSEGPDGGAVRVVVSGSAGYLSAWIDWGEDGAFDDPADRILNMVPVTASTHTNRFDVPLGVFPTTTAYTRFARFRLVAGAAPTLTPGGEAVSGEVEDYKLTFTGLEPQPPHVLSHTPTTNTLNVATGTSVVVTFSENIDAATVDADSFNVDGSLSCRIDGTYSVVGNQVTFDPAAALAPGEWVTVTLTTNLLSTAGLPLSAARTWRFTVASGAGARRFADFRTIRAGFSGARCAVAVDLDRDGDMDALAVANFALPYRVSWFENDGNQGFSEHLLSSTISEPEGMFPADLDGDGDIDIVVFAEGSTTDDRLLWFENDGAQAFTAHPLDTENRSIISASAADVDGDGNMDILAAYYGSFTVKWYQGDGSGNFIKHTVGPLGRYERSVSAADVDGDGDNDVIAVSMLDSEIRWYENRGGGTFVWHAVNGTGGLLNAVAADVDGDGDMDFVSSSRDGDRIDWYENDGSQNFTAHFVATVNFGSAVRVADMDGDGDMDLVSASQLDDRVAWCENDGSQNFTQQTLTTGLDGAFSISAADMDGDGDLDLLATGQNAGTLVWFEQRPEDYGDLPASYAMTTAADNGARHGIPDTGGIRLGAAIDAEFDGYESADAGRTGASDSDDGNGYDDEEGIAPVGSWREGAEGGSIRVIVSGGAGFLSGWIDWAGNNQFTDAGDQVMDMVPVAPGTQTNAFDIPAGAIPTNGTYCLFARFRLWTNSTPALTTGGLVENGEVEDHRLEIPCISRRTLEIRSLYGSTTPVPGVYTNDYGTALTNSVTEPPTAGTTQYVCTGWAMTANAPLAGVTTNFTMTLTNNAVLTWTWRTNYWLDVAAMPGGSVDTSNGWLAAGSPVTLAATSATAHAFQHWTGDVPAGMETDNPLTVTMDQPRTLRAVFANATLHVDAARPDDSGDGGSWGTAKRTLQAGVDAAIGGDTILLAAGIYAEGGRAATGCVLTNRVCIETNIAVRGAYGPYLTIIEGSGHDNGDGALRGAWLANGAVLDGVTVRGGHTFPTGPDIDRFGGGIYATAGCAISNCIIAANMAVQGAGVHATAGCQIRNCVVAGNFATSGGAGFYLAQSSATYCTVVQNTCYGGGGAARLIGASLHNSITAWNAANPGSIAWMDGASIGGLIQFENRGDLTYWWTSSSVGSIVLADPMLVRLATPGPDGFWGTRDDDYGDMRLRPGSPCAHAGSPAAAGADLDGYPRDTAWDTGAYEYRDGQPIAAFEASPIRGPAPLTVTFTNTSVGTADAARWDFDADGAFDTNTTADVVTWTYTATGTYSVTLEIDVAGVTSRVTRTQLIAVGTTRWVDAARPHDGGDGLSPATAKRTIQAAVDEAAAGDLILVADGVYDEGGRTAYGRALTNRVCIDRAVTVRSLNGAEAATIVGSGGSLGNTAVRGVWMSSDSTLEGFALARGRTRADGDGEDRTGGGALLCRGGTLNRCVVAGCQSQADAGGVGGRYGGTVQNSLIYGNRATTGNGGGMRIDLGRADNCLIAANTAVRAGGAMSLLGLLNNTVFVDNRGTAQWGAFYVVGSAEANTCIHADNGGSPTAAYGGGIVACTQVDPRFVRRPAAGDDGLWGTDDDDWGDLRTLPGSPCIDAANPDRATTTDFAGNARDAAPDIGPLEDPVPADFGDLPAAYALTTFAENGPIHVIPETGSIRLGAMIDAEHDGLPDDGALGDDGDGTDDEDGIAPVGSWREGPEGGSIRVIVSGGAGFLSGWIDWAGNNQFTDAGDQVMDMVPVAPGTQTNAFDIPAGAIPTNGTYRFFARFRLWTNSTPALSLTGAVDNGEVEDYALAVTGATNQWPVVDAGGPYYALVGRPLTLAGSANDPDGDALTVAWDFDYDGITFDADDSGTLSPTFASAAAGTRTVALRASDIATSVVATTSLTVYDRPVTAYVSQAGMNILPYTNWAMAATDIQTAVDTVATNGGVVLVSNGLYAVSAHILVTNAITVRGYYGAAATTIDGQDATRCFMLTHTNAVLDGLTIAHAHPPNADAWDDGGGVYLDGGWVVNCTIASNRPSASGYGGGIYVNAVGVISNCAFYGNQVGANGAGVCLNQGGLVTHCAFTNNAAQSYGGGVHCQQGGTVRMSRFVGGDAYSGGGISLRQGGLAEHCEMIDNHATYDGAGCFLRDGGWLLDSLVVSNHASNTSSDGGGVAILNSGTVIGCTIEYNELAAGHGGGIGLLNGGTVSNCTVRFNAARLGGGVYFDTGGLVRGCPVLFNQATTGGGVYFEDGGILENCTVSSNAVADSVVGSKGGGGVYCDNGGTLINAIVYHNRGDTGPEYAMEGTGGSFVNCCTTPDIGVGCVTPPPEFVNLAAGDCHLQPWSPCIDKGADAAWMVTATDIDGAARVVGAHVDIGADEYASKIIGYRIAQADVVGGGIKVDVAVEEAGTYVLLARDNDIDAAPTELTRQSTPTGFTYTDPGVVGTLNRRFYQVARDDGGVMTTNPTVWAAYVTAMQPTHWYRLAMPIDLGASNRLDSALGAQLRRGLAGDYLNGDLLFVLDAAGSWHRYDLDGSGTWLGDGGAPSSDTVESWQSFWIRRRSSGVASNAVYAGAIHTNAEAVAFRADDWHMIAWPFARAKREDAGAHKGWGFAAAGAHKGTSWMNADTLMLGDSADAQFLYLNEDGRWCRPGETTPAADAVLEAAKGYYYHHVGSGFTWTPRED